MSNTDFNKRLAAVAAETETQLQSLLADSPAEGELARPQRLLAAMRHAVLGGGKRLRPFLVVETAALFGATRDGALLAGRGARVRALLFAGARRSSGDGQ